MVLAVHHGRQANAWIRNVVQGFSAQLAEAGLHTLTQGLPTICFLDITGYTRMTAQRGDSAAAQLATDVARIVQRTAASYAGKPIKWLGDGVMVYFEEASASIVAALEMLTTLAAAGMPPAHVGIHTGEVHFNQGDYFGQTVNVASRIADFARPGEVLVSRDAVDAAGGALSDVRFEGIGPVELKGLEAPIELFAARRGPPPA
jgi:adenylate cyclase